MALPYHKMLVQRGASYHTIGGGIGQSRLYMLLLDRAHIGRSRPASGPVKCRKHAGNIKSTYCNYRRSDRSWGILTAIFFVEAVGTIAFAFRRRYEWLSGRILVFWGSCIRCYSNGQRRYDEGHPFEDRSSQPFTNPVLPIMAFITIMRYTFTVIRMNQHFLRGVTASSYEKLMNIFDAIGLLFTVTGDDLL